MMKAILPPSAHLLPLTLAAHLSAFCAAGMLAPCCSASGSLHTSSHCLGCSLTSFRFLLKRLFLVTLSKISPSNSDTSHIEVPLQVHGKKMKYKVYFATKQFWNACIVFFITCLFHKLFAKISKIFTHRQSLNYIFHKLFKAPLYCFEGILSLSHSIQCINKVWLADGPSGI